MDITYIYIYIFIYAPFSFFRTFYMAHAPFSDPFPFTESVERFVLQLISRLSESSFSAKGSVALQLLYGSRFVPL